MKKFLFAFSFLVAFSFQAQGQISQNMTLLGQVFNPNLPITSGIRYNDCWGWVDSLGREFAVFGSLGYTYFVNITNPSSPVVCDSVAGGFNTCTHRDFKTYGKYCYGVADQGTSSLQIFDMSYLPDSVRKVYDSNAFFTRCHNIWIDTLAGRLYAVGTNIRNSGIICLNLAANPASPTLLSSLDLGHYTHDIYVRQDTAWCSNGVDGYYAYDYRNATAPVPIMQLSTYPHQGYNHSSWLTEDGRYSVMADETHGKKLKVVDVSNVANPTVVSMFRSNLIVTDTGSIPHNPFMAGNYCVISYYHDGIQIFDLSNPLNPFQTAWYDTQPLNTNYAGYNGAWGAYPYFPSSTVIGCDVVTGLYILRVGFPFPRPLDLNVIATDASCNAANDGSILVAGAGGTGPYTFSWAGGQIGPFLSGLGPGWYVVTMADRYGYSISDSILILEPTAVTLSGLTTNEFCPGDADGCVDLTVSGGTPPYIYAWNTTPTQTTEDVCSLAAGNAIVTIRDANGCSLTDTFAINLQNNAPVAGFSSSSVFTTVTFSNLSTSALTFQWEFGDGNTSTLQDPVHTFPPGNYTVCLYATNVCGTDTICDTLTIIENSANLDLQSAEILVYPNPAKNHLIVETNSGSKAQISRITIEDLSGRMVYSSGERLRSSLTVPVQNFAPGVYFAKIWFGDKIQVVKWLKE